MGLSDRFHMRRTTTGRGASGSPRSQAFNNVQHGAASAVLAPELLLDTSAAQLDVR